MSDQIRIFKAQYYDAMPFVTVSNEFIQSKEISLKAKGLMCYLLSLPANWIVYKKKIAEELGIGKDGLQSAWMELEYAGYVHGQRATGNDWDYTVHYKPKVECGKSASHVETEDGKSASDMECGKSAPIKEIVNNININTTNIKTNTLQKKVGEQPTLDEFLMYSRTLPVYVAGLEYPLTAKYNSWHEAKWRDGHGTPIKNWKTKIQNTIGYLKPTATYIKPTDTATNNGAMNKGAR